MCNILIFITILFEHELREESIFVIMIRGVKYYKSRGIVSTFSNIEYLFEKVNHSNLHCHAPVEKMETRLSMHPERLTPIFEPANIPRQAAASTRKLGRIGPPRARSHLHCLLEALSPMVLRARAQGRRTGTHPTRPELARLTCGYPGVIRGGRDKAEDPSNDQAAQTRARAEGKAG